MKKYKEYKQLNLPEIGEEILKFWKQEKTFEQSILSRPVSKPFNFYEGPPSANGMPGIHHVMSRAIKDIFCRYKTLQGYRVERKAGWDTHGLPIELAVEKSLGITKEDIGIKISVDEYNASCRKEVMKYTDVWNNLTEKMGYWVDMENPYITYENNYIETLWYLLKKLYDKQLLYKGYTVQPYSPAAGTGLSSHELNQPGTYRNIKDTSIVAQFHLKKDQNHPLINTLFANKEEDTAILAWTTTPWTLPSNCALAVGIKIKYVKIKTFNPYTFAPINVVLAKDLIGVYFKEEAKDLSFADYTFSDKLIPWKIEAEFTGKELLGLRYHQLMPFVSNAELEQNAFRVIPADFVTTEDGTGIVHTASVFGADDFRVCKENNVPSVMVKDERGNESPLVDKQGKFVKEVTDFAGKYVREEYYSDDVRKNPDFRPTDVLIAIQLKEQNKAFKVEKYEHSYPHCWRTDKPILYYPLDSWFIKTTAYKDKMVALNKTINWKPESTGTGRFGNWLENLVDWNLSRSRFWGTPLPIWRTEDGTEEKCIGSVEELTEEFEKAKKFNIQNSSFNIQSLDLHRPYVDDIILVAENGKPMFREPDLIDVWFDSGAMPYAQWHYPFENKEKFDAAYPADFIAEGVDQTRGWFFTLHAIAVMLFDSVAYKNVVSNGLVLDKNGNKMSKRLGNAADPFTTIQQYGADATRWYMISNAAPWENLKFNADGIVEVQRKFFGTLYNTYSFFALYANIDGFEMDEQNVIPVKDRPELDRWILSALQKLILEVEENYENYDPTKAARAIQDFTNDHLSNWYVRLSRRRFWRGEMNEDKRSAYETLFECLMVISQLMSPVAPFFADWLYKNLSDGIRQKAIKNNTPLAASSVHLSSWTKAERDRVDEDLLESMSLAQDISSLILSLRKKVGINVRQPLQKAMIPVLNKSFSKKVERITELILTETNIKSIEFIQDTSGLLTKKIKPNFKTLGKKAGPLMKEISSAISTMNQPDIAELEETGKYNLTLLNTNWNLSVDEVEILSEDIPGWQVASIGKLTVALDTTITTELKNEGIARELINRIQNLRKEKRYEVTDTITVKLENDSLVSEAVKNNLAYICAEILGTKFQLTDAQDLNGDIIEIENKALKIELNK